MKKDIFIAELESYVKETGAENCTKQSITGHMVVKGASAAMCMRLLKNDTLSGLGVAVEARGASPEIVALRESIDTNDFADFESYDDVEVYAEKLGQEHDAVEIKRIVKEIKAAAKSAEVTLPGKGNLGTVKKAIIDYFADRDLATTSIPELATYLWDETDVKDKETAFTQARQLYTFSRKLIENATK